MEINQLPSDQREMIQHAFQWGCATFEQRVKLFKANEHYRQMYMSLVEQRRSFLDFRPDHRRELLKFLKGNDESLYLAALKLVDLGVIIDQIRCLKDWKDRRVVLETVEQRHIPDILRRVGEPICLQIIHYFSSKAREKHLKGLTDKQLSEWKETPVKIGDRYVATNDFVSELGDSAKKCAGCLEGYKLGESLGFLYCTEHTFHVEGGCRHKKCSCTTKVVRSPFFGLSSWNNNNDSRF